MDFGESCCRSYGESSYSRTSKIFVLLIVQLGGENSFYGLMCLMPITSTRYAVNEAGETEYKVADIQEQLGEPDFKATEFGW